MATAAGAEQRKVIIRTALILAGLTAFEFLIAFTWRPLSQSMGIGLDTGMMMKNSLFIILTIFKAFYIIGEFMHLKHEVKRLIWVILIPFIFIVWLIIALMNEGGSWGDSSPENAMIEVEQLDTPEVISLLDNTKIYG